MSGMDLVVSNPVMKAFLAGSMSGTCSTILFQPLDVIKTRLQLCGGTSHRSSMSGEFKLILSNHGISGLWSGLQASLCRTVPGVGLYFSSMHWMRNSVCDGRPSPLQSLLIGGAARTFAGSVMIPFTVVKTRMESGVFQYRSVTAAISSILATEGIRGLTRGLGPTLVRDVPFSGLYLAFYDVLKSKISTWNILPPECVHMTAGLTAGLLASLVTQPADVVKTRMQTKSLNGLIKTVSSIYSEDGLRGFSTGLAPRMLRRTVMAALAWTLYERVNTTLSLK